MKTTNSLVLLLAFSIFNFTLFTPPASAAQEVVFAPAVGEDAADAFRAHLRGSLH